MGERISATTVDIQMINGFQVIANGQRLRLRTEHRRALELVKLLALRPAHRMRREEIIEALWQHLDAAAALANLHKAASYARSSLGSKEAVVLRAGWVQLWPAAVVSTDIERFEQDAEESLRNGNPEQCSAAADTYGAGLLPEDRYAEWTVKVRERLRRRYIDLLRCAGRWAELAEEEPTDEHAHCELIRDMIKSGRRHAAIRQWQRLRDALAEVGAQPGEESLGVWQALVDTPIASHRGSCGEPPLVGREYEFATACHLLTEAAAGNGTTLLISGDPGIGKSRLAEALGAEAASRGWAVLRGGASLMEGAAPLAPIAEAFSRILRQQPELADALSEAAREGLRRLFGKAAPSPTGAEVRGRQPILMAASQLLEAAAAGAGAVLWIDDMHAADEATVQLVHYVARTARRKRVLVVLSYETGGLPRRMSELRASLLASHGATEIELPRLGPQAAAAIVRAVAGPAPSDATIASIYRLAEGNPFFTEEIADSIKPDGSFAVPQHLRDIVQARLRALEPGLRSVLQKVSVAGVQFTADEFAAFAGLDHAGLSDMLDAALRVEIVVEVPCGYRFRHALVREVLQASLAKHRRCASHRRVAEVLVAAGAAPGRIAHHLLAAGLRREAVPWLERAAFEAASVGAVADALALADRALNLEPNQSALLELRANCLFASGKPTCVAAFTDAIGASRGHRRRRLRIRLARVAVMLGDLSTARRALDGLVPVTPAEQVQLCVAEGYVAIALNELLRAERCAEQARRVALDEGLAAELTDAATLRGLVAHCRGDWQHQIEIDLLDTSKVPQLAASIHDGHLCVVEHYLDGSHSYGDLIAFAHRLCKVARLNGAGRGLAFATLMLGEAELLAGQQAEAETHLHEAVELHQQVGSAAGQSLALQRCAEAAILTGQSAEARELLPRALDLARRSTLLGRHLLYRVYGTMVDAASTGAQALAVVEEAESAVSPSEACRTCSVTFLLPAARAWARAGDQQRARTCLSSAKTALDPSCQSAAWAAAIAETEAVLADAAGQEGPATSLRRKAAGLYAAAGQVQHARRCEVRLAPAPNGATGQTRGTACEEPSSALMADVPATRR